MRTRRHAKIVATSGPASSDPYVTRALFEAGVDVFRLNRSRGTPEDHRRRFDATRAPQRFAGPATPSSSPSGCRSASPAPPIC